MRFTSSHTLITYTPLSPTHPHCSIIAEEEADNVLLADILTVLKQLVQYGYYDDDEDVNSVLSPLTKILDGEYM